MLEVCFRTYQNPQIRFAERGRRLDDLISAVRQAVKIMTDSDRDAFCQAWLERLIDAAVQDGAKIPKKRKEPSSETVAAESQPAPELLQPADASSASTSELSKEVIEIDESDLESPPPPKRQRQESPTASTSLPVVIINRIPDMTLKAKPTTKQTSLNGIWKKKSQYTEEEIAAAREVERIKDDERMRRAAEMEQLLKARKGVKERELNREHQQRFRDRK
ncbi:hypothetical protein NLJ89_g11017 [Agrocybe chaxingu]|uniref:Uncharacterized protein n=1 Tax=Agrocybe chaxingu TaxID=84603 RepID=A0A9W8JQ57_9AGAR|nr:hypothetical protein NLJ89_g11017 [Agrocybe chaxingu]